MSTSAKNPNARILANKNGLLIATRIVRETATEFILQHSDTKRPTSLSKTSNRKKLFTDVDAALAWIEEPKPKTPHTFKLTPVEVGMMAADPQCLRRLVKLTMSRERCAELHAEAQRIEDAEAIQGIGDDA